MPHTPAAVSNRRGSYASGRARRDEIVQAAIVEFSEVGYYGASLRQIAARAGITHPGLLHHFPTKDALLAAVLAHRDAVDLEAMAEDKAQGRSYLEALVRLVERNGKRRAIVELYAALSGEATSPRHPAHAFFAGHYELSVRMAREAFDKLRDDGLLRQGVDPAWAARAVVALMDGLQIQWLQSLESDTGAPVDMARDLRAFLESLTLD